jgi:hypothetical protein
MPKYLVETVSMFRMRYVIECESAEHAMDEVSCGMDEFAQKHIGETIVSTRIVSDAEIPEIFFEDSPYLRDWGPEKALEHVVKIKY